MSRFLFLVSLLSLFWLLNSGHYSFLMLSLGVGSIAFVIFLSYRMKLIDDESMPLYMVIKFIGYCGWLIKQIILSNMSVVKLIWSSNDKLSPTLKTIHVSQKTDVGKVIYANSITVTPGTVTVDITDEGFLVHALESNSITELEQGDMDKRVSKLEGQC